MGAAVILFSLGLLLSSCTPNNVSAQAASNYRAELARAGSAGPAAEKQAVERFTSFLKNIGSEKYIRENTAKVYARDAYLDDTLTKHRGAADIEAYFVKTSQSMTSAEVTIDDVAKSGPDYYVRWTMIVTAPALAKGEPVHSIGISQVRFDPEGKVAIHQDFWDSGEHFFGKLPVAGGVIGFIRKRLE